MTEPGAAEWLERLLGIVDVSERDAARQFAARLSASYLELVPPELAVVDLHQVAALEHGAGAGAVAGATRRGGGLGGPHRLHVRGDPGGGDAALRLRRYGQRSVELSTWLPVVESFGLVVVEAVPVLLPAAGSGAAVHIDDLGLRSEVGRFRPDTDAPRLLEALEAVSGGRADADSLNRLVLAAGLDWPQVALLRTYRRYRRQAGSVSDDAQLDDPLVEHPGVAAGLVAYFGALFDPEGPDDPGSRAGLVAAARSGVLGHLGAVAHLAEDRVLRGYLALIDATVRTTYFRAPASGPETIAVKLDSARVPDLPAPHPHVETWVHGPRVDAIHLRFGPIARGGIRWSDRPDDVRTEVLGLAEAQVKKNAIIVPTGAKGGFVCRRSVEPDLEEIRAAYATFMGALLDISDNLVGGALRRPERVVALDGDDPYLVVAADRGTATFSDVANQEAEARHFWLGDAFASGGSHGYDHKAMGITARGAWVAVRRHFHQLGMDVATEPISVVGVGDMSGDVFGNGMLQSASLRLLAAFDHRHVFVDPDPDPARSFQERRRLAGLPRSSWDDYDRGVLSDGGGVWARDVKTVPLAPAARRALGVTAESLSPPELISAILAAPVDLVYFGGIGTYVRSPGESDDEVEDHDNDDVRITADQLRARVVAEGGNLAVTQRARIHYSRRGGRINTDFIDNAAGVATSDREVNVKILLALAIERGRLDPAGRDACLQDAEGHVASEVLRQVDHSVAALGRGVAASARHLDAHEALVDGLEAAGRLDRVVEDLPERAEWQRRREAGAGMIRPELAVVLAYAKSELVEAIEGSGLPAEAALLDAVSPYFAPALVDRFGDLVASHRLFAQLLATDLGGEIVDRMGVVWAHETAAELGVSLADVAGAYWSARQVLAAGDLWDRIEAVGLSVPADADAAMHATLADGVGELARCYLRRGDTAVSDVIGRDAPALAALLGTGDAPAPVPGRLVSDLVAVGVPAELAGALAARRRLGVGGDVVAAARTTGRDPDEALGALSAARELIGLERIADALAAEPHPSRWQAWGTRGVLDDLADWCLDAVVAAHAGAGPGVALAEAMAAWAGSRRAALARSTGLLSVLAEGRDTLAVASVMVRNLRSVR